MADFNSSLPVRTENPGDVAAKIVDGTTTTQALAVDASGKITVKLDDAAGTGITSQANGGQQALDVGINVAGVQIDPRLAEGAVTTAAPTYTTGTNQQLSLTTAGALRTDSSGSTQPVSGIVTANQGTPNTAANGWPVKPTDGTNSQTFTAAGEALVKVNELLIEDHNYGVVGASTLRTAAQVGNATGAADFNNGATGAQTLRTAANLAVLGANVTATNPVPVSIVSATSGTAINDYKDATAIASSASDNHDYTVSALKTLTLSSVIASASGKAKMLISVETGLATGIFTPLFVQFNSTAETNMQVTLTDPISVATGVRVRVVMTNRDLLAQDLYSTICGTEN